MNAQNLSVACADNYSFHLSGKFEDNTSDIRVDQNGKI